MPWLKVRVKSVYVTLQNSLVLKKKIQNPEPNPTFTVQCSYINVFRYSSSLYSSEGLIIRKSVEKGQKTQ